MRPNRLPLPGALPDLPRGCAELCASAHPDSDTVLRDHLESLPGLDQKALSRLSGITDRSATALEEAPLDSTESVLGLEDLLRIRTQGFETLHPRVQQVVPVGAQDSLLKTVIARLGRREDVAAFQYPEFLLGCRGADYVSLPLHHPEFHIRNLEVMRELRANDILTTVCGKEDALPSRETIRATVDSIEESHGPVTGVFTLMMDDFDQSPNPFLVYHDDISLKHSPGEEALFEHVSHLLKKYRTELKVADISIFPPQSRGD